MTCGAWHSDLFMQTVYSVFRITIDQLTSWHILPLQISLVHNIHMEGSVHTSVWTAIYFGKVQSSIAHWHIMNDKLLGEEAIW